MNKLRVITRHIVKTTDVGLHNNLFGGVMMAWVDEASAAHAMKIAKTSRMVTVSIDDMILKKPAKVGDLVNIYGGVEAVGRTSITLNVKAVRYHVPDGLECEILCT
jgi:acyl-CoA thioesterase YciA